MAEAESQIWEVVGGGDAGGILVRAGKDTSSKQEDIRLSTGALVKELTLAGTRLHYELLVGDGPASGWVSTSLKGKDLVTRTDKKPETEEGPKNKDGVLMLANVRAVGADPETWWHRFRKEGSNFLKPEPPDPDAPKTGILPLIPRPNPKALPNLVDLPESIQASFRVRKQTPYARMFCFYGIGDSAGQWMRFIDDAPSWCEVIVYECKAHGIRFKETWDRTYEERCEDVWENMLPAFKQHARGGECEGAPFAIYCHSGGIVPMTLMCQRLKFELGLEPTAVYVADQRPANMPFLNEAGLKLATEDPVAYIHIWQPPVGKQFETGGRSGAGKLILERWTIGLLMLEEWYRWCRENGEHPDGFRDKGVYHVCDCPIFVFSGTGFAKFSADAEKGADHIKSLPAETRKWLREKDAIAWQIPDGETGEGEMRSWDKWTTKEVTYTYVEAAHDEIWYHFDTEQPLWRSFMALGDIHSRMPKKDKPKRNF